MTVPVVPPPFSCAPCGVTPWQETHTLPQSVAPSRATGVTLTVAEAGLDPAELIACTEHEYVTPLVRPLTAMGEAAPEPVWLPGWQVAE